MTTAFISPLIALDEDRSALFDVKNNVLYLTLWRLLSRFELAVTDEPRRLADANIHTRIDPVTGCPCISVYDIPSVLNAIRPTENDHRFNRLHMITLMRYDEILIGLEHDWLLDFPRRLSEKMLHTLPARDLSAINDWRKHFVLTQKLCTDAITAMQTAREL